MLRQGKVSRCCTEVVRGDVLTAHLLAVGVAQRQCNGLSALNSRFHCAVVDIVGNGGGVQRLAGTIERAVGEEVDIVVHTLIVPVVEVVVDVLDGQSLVVVGVGHEVVGALVTIVQDGFSIAVSGERLQCLLCVAVVVEEAQVRSGNRFAGGGVDSDKADGLAGLRLMEYAKVAYAQQGALRINAGVAGGGLNQVYTHGQGLETNGVGALFPCRLTIVLARDGLDLTGEN